MFVYVQYYLVLKEKVEIMKSVKTGKIVLGTKEKKSDVDDSMSISKIIGIVVYIALMVIMIVNIYLDGSSFYKFLDTNLG